MPKPQSGQPVRVVSVDGMSALHGVLEKETAENLYVVPTGAKKAIPLDKDVWAAEITMPLANGTVLELGGRHVVRVAGRWMGIEDGVELVLASDSAPHVVLFVPEPLPAPEPPLTLPSEPEA